MAYEMEIKDEARAALRALPDEIRRQIGHRLHRLQQDFSGIVVYTVGPRKDLYR